MSVYMHHAALVIPPFLRQIGFDQLLSPAEFLNLIEYLVPY